MRNTRNLDAAFKVVARYDPDTYAKMVADDWDVIANIESDVMGVMQGWFGATGHNQTAMSLMFTNAWAEDNDCDPDLFTAAVLVHEYRHLHQPDPTREDELPPLELPAYDAGMAFAAKLPQPCAGKIIAMAEDAKSGYAKEMAS